MFNENVARKLLESIEKKWIFIIADDHFQYMKAMRATLTTSRPVISEKEFQTMFFKIDELYEVHTAFLNALKTKIVQDTHDLQIGGPFVDLANHINIYGAFLHNYGQAIDTVKKCGENNVQFKEIVSKIVLNSQNEQLLTLEDLLHKPVARLQKNALVLQDLIKETPSTHPDFKPLLHAQKTIHKLLSEFNVVQNKSAVSCTTSTPARKKCSYFVFHYSRVRIRHCDAW